MKRSIALLTIAGALALPLAAQTATPKGGVAASAVPRMPDGHPDLSGVWWRGADVGGRGGQPLAGPRAAAGMPANFPALYTSQAQAEAKKLSDKDDPTLGCMSTAFGTLNVGMFDVGAVGQIVQKPKFVIFLTETYHSYQLVPFDGRPHRDTIPPANRGDAVGHWEGDTLVVDKDHFTDNTWISAEGRVSPHSDALHIIERYHRVDANTLEIEATLEDPKMLTKPWVVPKQTLTLAPFDQIMTLDCNAGDTKALIEAATPDASKK
jgi:hypothetical protein